MGFPKTLFEYIGILDHSGIILSKKIALYIKNSSFILKSRITYLASPYWQGHQKFIEFRAFSVFKFICNLVIFMGVQSASMLMLT